MSVQVYGGGAPRLTNQNPDWVPIGPALAFPFLDAWRVIAAFTVLFLHLQMQGYLPPELPSLLRIGHLAVIVFFVISGYSVAYSAYQHRGQPQKFIVARWSRIYSIAIPAMLFALVLDQIAGIQNSPLYPVWQYSKWWLYFGFNALFLGEHWTFGLTPFSIAPYWSLSYEFWFYVLMSVMMLRPSFMRTIAFVLVLLFIGPKICVLLPCWLVGVWAFRLSLKPTPTIANGAWLGSAVFLLIGWIILASGVDAILLDASKQIDQLLRQSTGDLITLRESRYFLADYLFSILFTAATLIAARSVPSVFLRLPRLRASFAWLAPHTFALYLLHYTLLTFANTKIPLPERPGKALLVFGAIVVICLLIGVLLAPTRKLWAQLFVRIIALMNAPRPVLPK